MKKTVLSIISLIAVFALVAVTVFADTIFIYNGYSYSPLDGDYISIRGWDNSSEDFVVPAQLDGSYIKEIGDRGMYGNTYITSVNFAPAIYMNRIGIMAFRGCTGLSGTLSIPNRITQIDLAAFQECSNITSVEYYASTDTIHDQCFNRCTSLKDVVISDGVKNINKLAFANCPELESVWIANSVSYISPSAFNNSPKAVISCYTGSYAHGYAVDNGIDYVLIDAPAPTEPTVATEPTVPTEATSATETTEPTVATEPATTVPVSYILGDVDNSGNVDVVDATFAQRYTIHASIPDEILDGLEMRADVDNTGELDSADVTFIMRHLIRVKTPYPIGETVSRFI